MKNILTLMLVSLATVPSFGGPLDILDAPGSFDGRFGRTSSAATVNSEISFEMNQGIRFVAAPWVEPYVGFTKYQQFDASNTEWISFGVKNKTLLAPFVFGVEYRNMVVPSDTTPNNLTVGYVSIFKDWNLKEK